MSTSPEQNYISHLDRSRSNPELLGQGHPAEKATLDFFASMGLAGRFATPEEDSGIHDIGPKPTIDGVVYMNNRPLMAPQITTSEFPDVRAKKLKEMKDRPFVRLDEMKPTDPAIPKVLIYLEAKSVKDFDADPDFGRHPEVALQILDSSIISLKFDLTQTKNPMEQQATQELITMLELEKRKHIH